jgi:hypothetical protein|nr:MAG TPA: hypothetical protein [Caudoviricetes sp.]
MNVSETNNNVGLSIGELGSIDEFLGQLEMPEDEFKVTPPSVDTDNIVETLKNNEDGDTPNTVTIEESKKEEGEANSSEDNINTKEVTEKNESENSSSKEKKETVEGVEEETSDSKFYKSIISDLVKEGLWESFDGIEDENGEVIPLDQVNIDKDVFYSIIASKIEEIKSKASENKISVDGVSDFMKRMIELEKKGGNVRQAMETYNALTNPIEALDLEKTEDQRKMVWLRYKLENKLDDQTITDIIVSREMSGKLEETAKQAKSQLEKAAEMQLQNLEQQAKERQQKEREEIKQYRADLSDVLNKEFKLKDSTKTRLLDLATKRDKEGLYGIDYLYHQAMETPEKATKLLLFLTNEEEYNQQISEKKVREGKINTMKSIRLIPKGKGSNLSIPSQNKESEDDKTFDPLLLFPS